MYVEEQPDVVGVQSQEPSIDAYPPEVEARALDRLMKDIDALPPEEQTVPELPICDGERDVAGDVDHDTGAV